MAYRVKITSLAKRNLADLYARINAPYSEVAFQWYRGLKDAIHTLRASPNRCPVTPEDPDLRHLLYANNPHVYRVIRRVLEKQKQVDVLHIRHGARDKFRPTEL
jgi:plasmid stabilization system protein ParE